ncbi:DUF3124 domain-containing protein [Roseivirga sp. BDSF3-8]|uniref:DUF3124 domain-containing protein n=1 Tax=Roseivirga sp. BDSF3-8 TaxID=3241598 RepID=UPI003531FD6A
MKQVYVLLVILLLSQACNEKKPISSVDPVNWDKRTVGYAMGDSFTSGTTYLSAYSQIYGQTESLTHDLTVTVSMRNTSPDDTVFVKRAAYYNTGGHLIRTYFDRTIYIAPMETVEIVIDEVDQDGGTGANFLFDWQTGSGSTEPLFEAVMISTSGQQGLSFTTQGTRIM